MRLFPHALCGTKSARFLEIHSARSKTRVLGKAESMLGARDRANRTSFTCLCGASGTEDNKVSDDVNKNKMTINNKTTYHLLLLLRQLQQLLQLGC
jgi:hypothetical protein